MEDDKIHGEIIFRWVPKPEDNMTAEALKSYDDVAEEYVVTSYPEALGGIIIYARYHGKLVCNPFCVRPLVCHLLRLVQELTKRISEKQT